MTNSRVEGADIKSIENTDDVLSWLLEGGVYTAGDEQYYAVLQCCDSLVWGLCKDGGWMWASEVFPAVRAPRRVTLMEARIFCTQQEILLWRTGEFDDELFTGRILKDSSNCAQGCEPIETRVHFWEEEERKGDFVKRTQPGGAYIITPPGRQIRLKHYLQEDSASGSLRIAVTRFVEIVKESN